MVVDLSGCWTKIERAHEHRNALQPVVTPEIGEETNLVQVSAQLDPTSRHHIFRVSAIPQAWRLRVAAMIGDVVHNARSALDHLVWQLSVDYSGAIDPGTAKRIKFPIEGRSERFANTRALHCIDPSYKTVIEKFQPYRALNPSAHPLAILQNLDNRDKHEMLNPILIHPYQFDFRTGLLCSITPTTPWDFFRAEMNLELGTEVVRMGLPDFVDAGVEKAGYIAPRTFLPDREVELISGLDRMVASVEDVVSRFSILLRA